MANPIMNQLSSENAGEHGWPARVAVLGVGLLGGSVAMAIRQASSRVQLVAWARSESKKTALSDSSVFDSVVSSVEEAVHQCDVVVVSSPVTHIAELVKEAGRHTAEDCLITDVGSTKEGIVRCVDKDSVCRERFVAAHPIAGSEKSGFQHARADLFHKKQIVLTPGSFVKERWIAKARDFWCRTGGGTQEMTPKDHDTHLAAISHVPHLVSSLVAKVTPVEARALAGSGWSDITRVAAGDPEMWTAICQENREAISRELDRVRQEMDRLQQIVDNADDATLQGWLAEAQKIKQRTPPS